jgi:hypothetical protein
MYVLERIARSLENLARIAIVMRGSSRQSFDGAERAARVAR